VPRALAKIDDCLIALVTSQHLLKQQNRQSKLGFYEYKLMQLLLPPLFAS